MLSQIEELMARRGAHASRTVVLVPYAQLMPLARRLWARRRPDGFSPRFDTTMNWAARLGFAPADEDLAFDMGRDLLTARAWLERAGLGARAGVLAGRLVEAAWQLGAAAAAVAPQRRAEWAGRAREAAVRGLGDASSLLALEAAVARIAVEWAAASSYASDTLWRAEAADGLDLLVLLQGLEADPLAQGLAGLLGDKAVVLPLDAPGPAGEVVLHEAADPSHEAEAAAACVVRHLQAGRVPVALAAVDRELTRRIRAMLGARRIAIRDETGWKLSTTRAAATVMAGLRACAFLASSDEVLDWLKHLPAAAPATVSALERRVRRTGLRDWGAVHAGRIEGEPAGWARLIEQANAWRERLQAPRPLRQWQRALRELLQATRQWDALEADAAGVQVLEVLGLAGSDEGRWGLAQAARRMTLADFTAWASDALEAESFVPEVPALEQVVILPFNQLLARPFAALVLPGCDELRLAPSPEPPGPWTAAQREALGLPARDALERALRAGWAQALRTPHCDVLWRRSDDSGEPVLPSPLVQQLRLAGAVPAPGDPREPRSLRPQPVSRPRPVAATLTVETLSASGYEDLRRCPYRFFALRQLGLQEAAEIDADLDKRDFGNWLHEVLGAFHLALLESAGAPQSRAALLDRVAAEVTRSQGLADGEFLPFAAAWPQVRDGYLDWLGRHEAEGGARFDSAERELQMPLGTVRLVGRIDRIDRLPDGRVLVMDYKTESRSVTAERVRGAGEDTQLAFYAALLEDDSLRAAYVNVGERGKTEILEQPAVVQARDALVEGILHDLRRIAEGAALPALGEGRACEFCAARGLCRRDFWSL
ncbi:PD-(D/E)XK nuclease family protein [Ramlibacter tataouinensis]|uniref:PD-(D/E)XK nuclease family protein n=1 Tax=Ramlibacter tataouinensis TaxID=94132 RepID=UPI00298A01E0|nr:PD-(D/E)XK nuclease family protein [Ramlibacter tataouinensis]